MAETKTAAPSWHKLVAEDSEAAWHNVLVTRERSVGLSSAKKEIVANLNRLAKRADAGKYPRVPKDASPDDLHPIDIDAATGSAKIMVIWRDTIVPITSSDYLVVKDQKDIPAVLRGIAADIEAGTEDQNELADIVAASKVSGETEEPKKRGRGRPRKGS